MADTLLIEPGKLEISDTDGRVVISTSIPQMHALTELSGVVAIPAAAGGFQSHYNATPTYTLGAVATQATHTIGACRIVWGSTPREGCFPSSGTNWWFVNGGSIVIYYANANIEIGAGAGNRGYVISDAPRDYLSAWTQFTPRLSGGFMYLDEITRIRGFAAQPNYANITRPAFDLYYKLKAVAFT